MYSKRATTKILIITNTMHLLVRQVCCLYFDCVLYTLLESKNQYSVLSPIRDKFSLRQRQPDKRQLLDLTSLLCCRAVAKVVTNAQI